jgi:hypothetical protein
MGEASLPYKDERPAESALRLSSKCASEMPIQTLSDESTLRHQAMLIGFLQESGGRIARIEVSDSPHGHRVSAQPV